MDRKMKLLIVDDNDDFREMLKLRLSPFAQCDTAADGEEACVRFRTALQDEAPYDLIFIDINMPIRDGFETVASIRTAEQAHGAPSMTVPIIFITGLAGENEARRAVTSKHEALVSKSHGVNRLLATMRALGCAIPENVDHPES